VFWDSETESLGEHEWIARRHVVKGTDHAFGWSDVHPVEELLDVAITGTSLHEIFDRVDDKITPRVPME
jgi:hypothetical protein